MDHSKKIYQERKRRIETAIRLETPDRVPTTSMVYTFAARFAGISVHDYIFNPWQTFKAHKIFNHEFQPDMNYMPATNMHPLMFALAQTCPVKLPGKELPSSDSWQSFEQQVMTVEDYDYIVKKGFRRFLIQLFPKIRPQFLHTGNLGKIMNVWTFGRLLSLGMVVTLASLRDAKNTGFPTFIGGGFESPFSMFSLARSMKEFTRDVYKCPDLVNQAIDKALPLLLRTAKFLTMLTGSPRINIGLHRESNFGPRQFEKIVLPQIMTVVDFMSRSGIVTVLHCDSNWGPHLHYLKQLPKGTCVIELDSATNIFEAKKILGGHICIKGDVPAYLLALGSKSEVMDYCRKLIDEVGANGGFILASGCEIPVDAKPENVAAMREAVEKYGWY